jgi:hypothetical protein
MTTFKRIDGDYNITTLNYVDNVNINTNTVHVYGNLDVEGNLTYINVTELNVKDPFIVLNSSNTGVYPANSGILTHRSSNDFAGLRWNNTSAQWEVSNSTSTTGETGSWAVIATGSFVSNASGSNTQVQFNTNNSFDASANFVFDKSVDRLELQGHLALGNLASAPAITANAVTLFNQTVGAGDSGVYALSSAVDDELVSRRRAIAFSIIF